MTACHECDIVPSRCRRRFWELYLLLMSVVCFSGCAERRCFSFHDWVASDLATRTNLSVSSSVPVGCVAFPATVTLDDGLTEDEAIETALANNALFQAARTQLGMAHGDLVQAGLLTNPNLTNIIPVGVKQWEWTLYLPIETFLLRPKREAMAHSEYHRIANQLVQNGLILVRDVRVSYTDLALAHDQAELAAEALRMRREIADITERRFKQGDISELEAMSTRIDALNAQANLGVLQQNVTIAANRLAALMGVANCADQLAVDQLSIPDTPEFDRDQLVADALCSRPDMRAAQWAVDTFTHRREIARWAFLRIDGVVDANGKGAKGFELGPGLRLDLPVFNRNEGGVMRADAELTQAMRTRDVIRDQITQEVRTAAAQLDQASQNLTILQENIIPTLDEASQIAQKGYKDGGASYLMVLQTTTQYLDAKGRTLDQMAALRRAYAELERAAGRSIGNNVYIAIADKKLPTGGTTENDPARAESGVTEGRTDSSSMP